MKFDILHQGKAVHRTAEQSSKPRTINTPQGSECSGH